MAYGDTTVTLVGNLVDNPELRFTPSGQAIAQFRIASTPRFFDRQTQEYKDGDSLFITCNIWREPAENVTGSLTKGMRVIVQGRLRPRNWETKEGEKRSTLELEVEEVGPSLRNATAQVTKRTKDARAPQEWQTATPQRLGPAGPAGGSVAPQSAHTPQPAGVGGHYPF